MRLCHVNGEDGWGRGCMDAFRLVNKRLMRVVESCATSLTYKSFNGTVSLPLVLGRCMTIYHITCYNNSLMSLDGCPDGLNSLYISNGNSLQSLELLRAHEWMSHEGMSRAGDLGDLPR